MRSNKRYHPTPFLVIGLILTALGFFVVRTLPGASFFYMATVALGGLLLIYGALNLLMNRLGSSAPRKIVLAARHIMKACLLIGILAFGFVEFLIIKGGESDAEPGADYVIVLGAALRGETPSLMLASRMEEALSYLRENPGAKAVLSGGQGPGEDIPEAEAMRRFFEASGIDAERLIVEDKSTNTAENIRFSAPLMEKGGRVVIVSNEFHLYRARELAMKSGLDAQVLSADTPYWYLRVGYSVREFFSVLFMFFGRT